MCRIRSVQLTEDVTLHKVTLTNLLPDTTYVFRVSSTDLADNGPTVSVDTSFTTQAGPDTIPPAFTVTPTVVSRTDQSVTIEWQTDELSDSFVRYDSASVVGKRMALQKIGVDIELYDNNVGDAEDVTSHRITLTGLTAGTSYLYGVGSIDKSNQESTTAVPLSFETEAAPDTVPPEVPENVVAVPGDAAVFLRWNAVPNAAGDLSGYNIYRSVDGSLIEVASQVPDTFYYDEGRTNGEPSQYLITSIDNVSPQNNESAYSPSVTATPGAAEIPTAPAPLSPAGGLVLKTPRPEFTFTNATGPRGVESGVVIVATDPEFLSDARMYTDIPLSGTETTFAFPSDLESSDLYYWRTRAFDGIFYGPWSEAETFNLDLVTAVELMVFEASVQRGTVELHWETAAERNNAGFHVYRKFAMETAWQRVTPELIQGSSDAGHYRFHDTAVRTGALYQYRLEAVDYAGYVEELGRVTVAVEAPQAFALHSNYPNPFNPATHIRFDLPKQQQVSLQVFNLLGQQVATLVDRETLEPGYYTVTWDGRNRLGLRVASGIYLYRIQAGRHVQTRKMLLLK